MVVAFDRRNKAEDTIMFEKSDRYVIQVRKNLKPVKEMEVLFEEENAYDRAEEVFDRWSA